MDTLRLAQHALPGFAINVVRLTLWLALLTVVFVPLERLVALRAERVFRKGVATDIGYYFLSSLLPSLLLSAPLALFAWGGHSLLPTGVAAAIAQWPFWMRLAVSLVVGEVGFYWGHRLSHEIPLLWRFHAVHHSAEHLDWLVNTRAHPVDMVFTRLCGLAPLYALGLAAPMAGAGAGVMPLLVLLFGTVWGFFVHANIRWRFGPLEWLIATPAFHHWHHTNDGPEFIDKNYAALFPWLDRIFGTLYLPARQRPERYGTDTPMPPRLIGQLVDPFSVRKANSPADQTTRAWKPVTDTAGTP